MSEYLSIIGVALSVVGSWFVAYEVVNQYRGRAFGGLDFSNADGMVTKLPDLVRWESARKYWMWTGLFLITVGGALQIAGTHITASAARASLALQSSHPTTTAKEYSIGVK